MPIPQRVLNKIVNYIEGQGEPYSNWYAGITSDIEKRLFQEHGILRLSGIWIHGDCGNEQGARYVEESLIKLGCDGDIGGGDNSTIFAYVYLKTPRTRP